MAQLRSILIFLALTLLPGFSLRADRIVLRNLDILSNVTVARFDEDGVLLDDGRLIGWDRIERGRVAEAQQAAFDRLLSELGSHLYRIRQRLGVDDDRGLLSHAEAVYDRYAGRRSETAYMVFQSLMWSRLAVGQREAALQPYLDCLECLREAADAGVTLDLPGSRRLQIDLKSGLSQELPPIWFDAAAAEQHLAGVAKTIAEMAQPRPPATQIYYATMALAAGQRDKAVAALEGLDDLPQLKAIVEAQILLSRGDASAAAESLRRLVDQLDSDWKPLAFYWLGRCQIVAADVDTRNAGMLDLLRIPALYGQEHPELAAAGLYSTMQVLTETGDRKGSISIRRELLDRYGRTWHAEKVRNEDN
jgi:hypothetical protein